jgi:hypothetical protein
MNEYKWSFLLFVVFALAAGIFFTCEIFAMTVACAIIAFISLTCGPTMFD